MQVEPSKWTLVPGIKGFYRKLRADGSYGYRFRLPRETGWTTNYEGLNLNEAKRWRNKELGLEEHERVRASQSTFGEVAQVMLANYRRRPASRAAHVNYLNTHLKPLAHLRVQEIDKSDLIQRVIKPMEAKNLSGSTIHNALMTASVVFEEAIDAKPALITVNPVRRLRPVAEKPSKAPLRKKTVLSATQFAALLEHAAANPDYRAIYAVMGLAGLRISEALGLVWADIRFDTGRISVELQISKDRHSRVELKTKESKGVIDMSPKLSQILAQHALDQGYQQPEDYVFINSLGRPYDPRCVQRALAITCQQAGIPVITPHELRHTCGSALLVATRDPAVTCKQMRHADPGVTLGVYAHEWGEMTEPGAVGAALDLSLGAAIG